MKMIAFIVLVLLAVIPGQALSQEPACFADSNLQAAVEEALGISNPTPDDMLGLFFLDASNRGIVDLTGIEHATNLLELGLANNEIIDITPLSGLTSLLWLDLEYNQIRGISGLSELTNVTSLFLNDNQISDISALSEFYFLFLLDLRHNPLNADAHEIYIPLIYDNNLLLHPFWWPIDYDPPTINNYELTIESADGGSVTIPGEGSFYYYDQESMVTLKAKPDPNHHFVSWTGTAVDAGKVADPNSAVTTVLVDSNYTLHANFLATEWSFAIITDCHIGERSGECIDVDFPIFGEKYWCDYGSRGWDDVSGGVDHEAANNLERVVDLINSKKKDHNIEFVVVLGDLSDSAEKSEFFDANEILSDLKVPWLPIIGNHDVWPKVPPIEELSFYEESSLEDWLWEVWPWEERPWEEWSWDDWSLQGWPWEEWSWKGWPLEKWTLEGCAATPNANPDLMSENGPDVYFNDVFETQYTQFCSALKTNLSNWKKEYIPVWNTELNPQRKSYFQNFAFDYKGYHFVGLDFNHRDWHILPLPGWPFDAELHDFGNEDEVECGSWKWFKKHLNEYISTHIKGDENIILLAHHPFRIIHSDELQELGLDFKKLDQQLDGGFDEDEINKMYHFITQYRSQIWCEFAGHTHKNDIHYASYGEDTIMDIVETKATEVAPVVRLVQFYPDGGKDYSVILQAEEETAP